MNLLSNQPTNHLKPFSFFDVYVKCRESLSSGCVLEKSQLAFSEPSSLGSAFGSNYFGTRSFLVYKAQVERLN